MNNLRHLPAILLGFGGLIVASALTWWALTFWPTVGNHYLSIAEAGRCLVFDSSLCRLATTLCGARHVALIIAYSPIVLWAGAATTFCGLTVIEAGGPTRRSRSLRSDLVGQRVQLPLDGSPHFRQGSIVEDTRN